jgi:hypothetical protein
MTVSIPRSMISVASVVLVASGSLLRVDPGGWGECGQAVGGDVRVPVAGVDEPVVVCAQQRMRKITTPKCV